MERNLLFEPLVYTEKEHALHIHGTPEPIESYKKYSWNPDFLTQEEINEFYSKGYFYVKSAVSADLIGKTREYVDNHYNQWYKASKRQDDWRIHYRLNFAQDKVADHIPILDLLLKSHEVLTRAVGLLGGNPCGIFYSQVAFRTPTKRITKPSEDYQDGAEYHLDGNANAFGIRFPDPWSVMVGIALVNIETEDKGNFTVFPGSHTVRNWSSYPEEKVSKTLPNLGKPEKVLLRAGDVVFVHPLLAHRGGRNTIDKMQSEASEDYNYRPTNIPLNTREMVFIRLQCEGIDYDNPSRGENVLRDPWCEFDKILTSKGLR